MLDKSCPAAYNTTMFLSALQPYVVFILIAAVLVQYAFAVFCLLKLAFMDITKNKYIIWNLIILFAVYIGGAVFLVYYYKHPELRIQKTSDQPEKAQEQEPVEQNAQAPADQPETAKAEENAEKSDGENTDKE